jgi:hypothetical protein
MTRSHRVQRGLAALLLPLMIVTLACSVSNPIVPALEANGVALDQSVVNQLTKDATAGDMPAAVNDLYGLTKNLDGYTLTQPSGIGTAALWSWHTFNDANQAALIAAKPGALVALILSGTADTKQADVQPVMEAIVTRILANLPDNFAVATTP